ncbi:MAG TPA: hypothetical protein VD859_03510 [Nocardioides sp.]|nr:hypothetical protein [Nocardioides sp.]
MTPLRRRLLLAGLLPAVLALLLAAKVGLMLVNDSAGRGAFDDGDHAAAAEEFAANQRLNLFQSWLAHFDEGAALHAGGDPDAAVDAYADALGSVPDEHQCLVRVNLALALEARGDAARRDGDAAAAREDWQAGVDALEEGGCRTEDRGNRDAGAEQPDGRTLAERAADARFVDRRLQEKLASAEPEEPEDPQENQLEENNEQAEQERQEIEEDVELRDSEDHPTW